MPSAFAIAIGLTAACADHSKTVYCFERRIISSADIEPMYDSLLWVERDYPGRAAPNLPESASRTSRSNFTLPVVISRSDSTGGLFLLTSRIGRAPDIS